MLANTNPLKPRLARVHELMESPLFKQDSREDVLWKSTFAELIIAVDELLAQAQQKGKRVDFYEGVGVHGKIQDITSLVDWLCDSLPGTSAGLPTPAAPARLNRYFGQGTGYFANGAFFTGEYEGDVAFFLDDQRIYLNRQIRRAVGEAELTLQTIN
ncbi:hypothetical protein [Spirosoma areae]